MGLLQVGNKLPILVTKRQLFNLLIDVCRMHIRIPDGMYSLQR